MVAPARAASAQRAFVSARLVSARDRVLEGASARSEGLEARSPGVRRSRAWPSRTTALSEKDPWPFHLAGARINRLAGYARQVPRRGKADASEESFERQTIRVRN